ncbi:MAG: deoxyguanosinetriphosphate triphosphohydrolase [Rickettsiales bacterium]|nr:deoxyguanosinetriphosphate triphosphohydrolase [Rickettsiales bacterium]
MQPNTKFLAVFASQPKDSRGRLIDESESQNRTPYQRDRDRIIHSMAFRRLEYKTQVFVNHEGDHYRTRLTHSLEVAQLARSIARTLELNEDLAEACALSHDMGHPPFGHAGEDALKDVLKGYEGFDHNAQTLRLMMMLEQRYAEFDGLNLTWETLEGIAKHNGPVKNPHSTLKLCNEMYDLELNTYASAEAQVAALADDIAYNNHDIDDGLRAGLFEIEDLLHLPLVGQTFRDVIKKYPLLSRQRLAHEGVRRVINAMVVDLLEETHRNLSNLNPQSVKQVRAAGRPMVAFSGEMDSVHRQLRKFLMERMYKHYKVNRMTSKARRVIVQLFEIFRDEPDCLPTEWFRQWNAVKDDNAKMSIIADYISGMTDRFAIQEHARLFDLGSSAAQG